MRSSRSWWAKSASLVILVVLYATLARGTVREGQGLAIAQCTASSFVTGYPAGDNTGFCAQPAMGNLGDYQDDVTCTWTPTDASGASLTFTAVSVSCTKIGNLYYIHGRLNYPTTTSTSIAAIGGLPATVANKTSAGAPGSAITNVALTVAPLPFSNTTQFELFTLASTAGVTNSQLSTALILFGFWYTTN